MLIELADVERLESEFSEALSVNQAARQLGIGRKTVLKLVNYKCLDFLQEPLANRRGELRFRRRGIDELLVKIGASVEESENLRSVEIVTFRTAQRKFAVNNIDEGQFVKALSEGGITPCGKDGDGTGLSAFLFRRDEITHYVKAQLAQRQDPLTVKQAASLYEISEHRIRLLIEQKFIPVIRNQSKRKPAILITKGAVQYCINTYVMASDLASRLATSPDHVIRLLEAKGITPVRRRRDNKLYRAVFKKRDLQNIDLGTEVLNAKGRYSQTNHKTKVLHIEQVATLLGTDMKTVSRLTEGGFLKSYSGFSSEEYGAATCHFTSRTLEGCKNRIVSYMCLLSEPRVKQIIRQTPTAFYVVRVKEGHPEPGKSEMESNIKQSLERNVGALITLLKQTMTLSEVEVRWGVEPRTLKRRIAKGALKTISKSTAGGFKYHLFLQRDVRQLHRSAT